MRFNPELVSNPGAVIAPPYDVISDERRSQLLRSDPNNFIRLILPEGNDDTRYQNAGELFAEWQRSKILVQESDAGLFLYTQSFNHPATRERIVRHGILARVRLSPFSDGEILPHERTLSGPKADRLKLMEATDANLEPIFGVYRDRSGASAQRLEALTKRDEPMIDATDADGVLHRVWRLVGPDIEPFQQELATNTVFIVDGHHRYETALNYRNARGGTPGGRPIDSILMFIAPMADPGLIILPTHRVVHSLESFDFGSLVEKLRAHFVIATVATSEEGISRLQQNQMTPSFLLMGGGRMVVATLKSDADISEIVDPALPKGLSELDVTILHEFIIESLLGISKEAQASQTNLRYVKSNADAFAESLKPDVQLVVMMNATRLDQVERVAESGHVMPQKSTYFYPKLASGLLINPLW
ncbi:MAG: DUF1015 domain-containing protein [bacterium]|nr:DUF1015 domain-containing protein [Candidatus Kapabacteria bacterium]